MTKTSIKRPILTAALLIMTISMLLVGSAMASANTGVQIAAETSHLDVVKDIEQNPGGPARAEENFHDATGPNSVRWETLEYAHREVGTLDTVSIWSMSSDTKKYCAPVVQNTSTGLIRGALIDLITDQMVHVFWYLDGAEMMDFMLNLGTSPYFSTMFPDGATATTIDPFNATGTHTIKVEVWNTAWPYTLLASDEKSYEIVSCSGSSLSLGPAYPQCLGGPPDDISANFIGDGSGSTHAYWTDELENTVSGNIPEGPFNAVYYLPIAMYDIFNTAGYHFLRLDAPLNSSSDIYVSDTVLFNIQPCTPTITSFSPTSGGTGTSVSIYGTNFTGATAVTFGGTAAASITVNSSTLITAVVGSGSTGKVTVTTPGGTATSSADFTFTLGVISGTVYQSDGTTPITGVQIQVNVQSGNPCGPFQGVASTTTNSTNGTYSITGVPPGTYYLHANNMNQSNYQNEWWASPASTTDCTGAQTVTVSAGGTITGKNFQLATGGTISGTVYQSNGTTPITGVQIHVNVQSGNPCGSTPYVTGYPTNSTNGTYSITGVPVGTYYLRTWNNGAPYMDEWWASPSSSVNCTGAQTVTVSAGGSITGKNFQLDSGGTISGTVYQSDGVTPVTGQRIQVRAMSGDPCGSHQEIGHGWTDSSNGTYTIGGLPAGTYYLWTNNYGANYTNEWWASPASTTDCTGAQTVTVSAGGTITGKNFQLATGGTISGTVYQSNGTTPITGVQIHVQVFSGNPCGSHQWVAGTTINCTNGTYSITGIPAGTYYLRTWNNGAPYMDEWWASPASTVNCTGAQTVTVSAEGTITGKNFQLAAGTTITGTVTSDSNAQPVEGVQICGWPFTGGSGACTNSQSDGSYTLTGLQLGYNRVQASGAGYLTEYYDNSYDSNRATAVWVAEGQATPNINFSMGKNGSISGTVYKADGTTPLPNVCVDAYSNQCGSSYVSASAPTDTDGNYTISNLPPQTYYIKTRAACTHPQHYTSQWWKSSGPATICDQAGPVTVASEQNTSGINFSLSPSQATYPGPAITSSALFSSHSADGESIWTSFWARISGPSPEDVASFTVTGPSGTYDLVLLQPAFRQFATSYQVNVNPVVDNGTYTFTLTDSLGRTATVTMDFTYDSTVPQVDSATMTPVNQSYVGTVTPTLTWDPVSGAATYQLFIWDYDGRAIWYTETTEGTSITIPEWSLQPDTPYYWYVRVADANGQNRRYSNTLYFYTGIKGLPDLSKKYALSFTTPDNPANWFAAYSINLAPWDINSFTATGPRGTVYPYNSRSYRFRMPVFYASFIGGGPIPTPDGTYTFELSDIDSNTDTQTQDFTYNPVPTVSEASMSPAPNSYGYGNRTFSWAPVSDPRTLFYMLRIMDYNSRIIWYQSPYIQETSWTIPDDIPIGPYGSYKWQVIVSDSATAGRNNASKSALRTITSEPLTTNNYALPGGTGVATDYRIFTVPFYMGSGANLLKQMETALGPYDPTRWRVFALQNGSYIELNSADFASLTIIPGMGFWIIARYQNTIQFEGALCPQDTNYKRELSPGWHMIALPWPATDITLGSIQVTDGTNTYAITDQDPPNTLTQKCVWDYTGSGPDSGYVRLNSSTDPLQHGTGYFIKVLATSNVTVIIPPTSSANSNTKALKSAGTDEEEPPPPPGGEPSPDIRTNGQDGPVRISSGTPVSVTVSLDPGSWAGRNADWWVAAYTPLTPPYDWYSYVYPLGWQLGIHVCAQTPLFDLSPPFEVLNMALPAGDYTFYFAVDGNADGAPDVPWLDSVEVTVE